MGLGETHFKEIWDLEGSPVWRQVRAGSLHPIWGSAGAHAEPLTTLLEGLLSFVSGSSTPSNSLGSTAEYWVYLKSEVH